MRIAPTHNRPDDNDLREKAARLAAEEPDALVSLIADPNLETACAAIMSLGLAGGMPHATVLMPLLRDTRSQITTVTEDAIWTIWMRAGSPAGNQMLVQAMDSIAAADYPAALKTLTELVAAEPGFAEAHHQRGVVAMLLDQHALAAECFRNTLSLNRHHFGAMAGCGHLAAAGSDWDEAIRAYKAAAKINPAMEGIHEAIELVESAIRGELAQAG